MTKAYRVNYNGMVVDVVAGESFDEGREMLRNEEDCTVVMASVHEALEEFIGKVRNGTPVTDEERLDFCDDVAIWLANEMNEGRSPYEEVDEKDFQEPFTSI